MSGIADFCPRKERDDVKAIGFVTGLGDMDASGITTKVAFLIEDAPAAETMDEANVVIDNLKRLGFNVVGFSSRVGIPNKFALDRLYIFDRDSARPFYMADVVPVGKRKAAEIGKSYRKI